MAAKVRPVELRDFSSIHAFLNELQGREFEVQNLKKIFKENIQNPNNIYLIAEKDDLPIGYLGCHTQTLLHHGGKVAEIQEMFIQKAYRNKGIGKQMMDEVKKIAQQKGALQLEVTTRMIRVKAIEFYKRESFEDTHKKLVYYF